MTTLRAPSGLASKGRKLWREVTDAHDLAAPELVLLEEACRIADRLDRLDAILADDDAAWLRTRLSDDGMQITVTVDGAMSEARQQANVLKQLIAALRLPDEATGKRPQQRGGARGAYSPRKGVGRGVVSSLERARAARSG